MTKSAFGHFPFHTVWGWERVRIVGLSTQDIHSQKELTELYKISKSDGYRAYIE